MVSTMASFFSCSILMLSVIPILPKFYSYEDKNVLVNVISVNSVPEIILRRSGIAFSAFYFTACKFSWDEPDFSELFSEFTPSHVWFVKPADKLLDRAIIFFKFRIWEIHGS